MQQVFPAANFFAPAAGETDERIFAVAARRDAPYFTEAKRAALALTEAVTRLNAATRQVAGEWIKSPAAQKWTEEQATAAR